MEESYAPTLMKLPLAIFNHAQLIVSWDNGPDGVIVTRHADKDPNKEPDEFPHHLPLEEKLAKVELKNKNAIPSHAQLTVFYLNGPSGAIAPNHVELDLKPELELLPLLPILEENPAKNFQPLRPAMSTHAQLIVSSRNGLNGANVTKHVDLVLELEADLSSKPLCLEELNAELLVNLKFATLNHAPSTVL